MAKQIKLPYKLLLYDIETGKVKYRSFSGGETVLRHKQLVLPYQQNPILCICAKFYGDKKIYTFEGTNAVNEFTELCKTADVIMGKNNVRFDDKHVNTHRLLNHLEGMPQLKDITDDLEQQLRKNFTFQSYSLEHVAKLLIGDTKSKMEDSDWNDIQDLMEFTNIHYTLSSNYNLVNLYCKRMFDKTKSEVLANGNKALNKMIRYCKKDVIITEKVLTRILPYIKLKHAGNMENRKGCITCGSIEIIPQKTIVINEQKYQEFHCVNHDGYAGKAKYHYNRHRHKVYGNITK